MFVIASNITLKDSELNQAFRKLKETPWYLTQEPTQTLRALARQCIASGANALEIDLHQQDHPEIMKLTVNIIQQITNCPLCLSTKKLETLEAGLKACKNRSLVNYASFNETGLRETLSLISDCDADVILPIINPEKSVDAQGMLKKAKMLIDSANEAGIPNEHIIIDPGLIKITYNGGQCHLKEITKFLHFLPEITDRPVKSTCRISNISDGIPRWLRPAMETTLLPMLAGLGLSSVFMDVLDPENTRVIRMLKLFNNEAIYSERDFEL